MPRYRFTGTEPRDWFGDGPERPYRHADPGDETDADTNPDPHWWEEIATTAATATAATVEEG